MCPLELLHVHLRNTHSNDCNSQMVLNLSTVIRVRSIALFPCESQPSSFLSSPRENKNTSLSNWKITSLLCVQAPHLPTQVRDTQQWESQVSFLPEEPKLKLQNSPETRQPFLMDCKWLTLSHQGIICCVCSYFPCLCFAKYYKRTKQWISTSTHNRGFWRTVSNNSFYWFQCFLILCPCTVEIC